MYDLVVTYSWESNTNEFLHFVEGERVSVRVDGTPMDYLHKHSLNLFKVSAKMNLKEGKTINLTVK